MGDPDRPVEAHMNADLKSIAAKTRAPRFCTALVLSAFVCWAGVERVEAGVNTWTSSGPYGGSVPDLVIDPQNPSTLYAGTDVGVFKTTDGGDNWTAINPG